MVTNFFTYFNPTCISTEQNYSSLPSSLPETLFYLFKTFIHSYLIKVQLLYSQHRNFYKHFQLENANKVQWKAQAT